MKTAVSVPDAVFAEAEEFARRKQVTRSQLFSDALREYLARHAPDEVTTAMDDVVANLEQKDHTFIKLSGQRVLEQSEW